MTDQKRVGHAGTLDPFATGVLVVCLGQAVRITEYLIDHDKVYRACVKLGIETDSYDATGRVLETCAVAIDRTKIESALASFVGRILQTPPAFSAIKVEGVRQYDLARSGRSVELEPRSVQIYSIQLRQFESDQVEFDVACSKGTYIRSLAHDLGARLGCGGHLMTLRRLRSGPFTVEEAHPLDVLRDAFIQERGTRFLIPLDRGLEQFDATHLNDTQARSVAHGLSIHTNERFKSPLVRAYDPDGRCLALLQVGDGMLKPHKVFVQAPGEWSKA